MSIGLPFQVEVCVVSLEQALAGEHKGANRVELCSRLETEGMTPGLSLIKSLCDQLSIPIRVMIRATEEGYEANDTVLREMVSSIHAIKELPVEGFVFGIMKNNRIDQQAMEMLLKAAHPLHVTFHKAIDLSEDMEADLDWINLHPQVDTILTSGGASKALEGIEGILKIKSIFHGHVMAAGKITAEVLPALHDQLQLHWYHGRAIV